MADVLVLFLAALIILAGSIAAVLTVGAGRRRRALAARERARRAEREPGELDDYLRRLGQAATGDDIDRLESERKRTKWDGLSSRSSSGSGQRSRSAGRRSRKARPASSRPGSWR